MKALLKTLLCQQVILFLGVFTLSILARAEGTNAQFGIVYGSSVTDAQNTKPYFLTGIRGQAYLYPSISAGGYYYFSDSKGDPSSTDKFRYSLHGLEVAYHMPAGSGEVAFSLRGGFSKVETETNGTKVTFSPFHMGFATGYDYFLIPSVSVGFEGSIFHIKKGYTTSSGTDYTRDAFDIINFLVTLQYRM